MNDHSEWVTNRPNDVTGQYRLPDPRADTRPRSRLATDPRWDARGMLAVAAVFAACLIMDGLIMMWIGSWQ